MAQSDVRIGLQCSSFKVANVKEGEIHCVLVDAGSCRCSSWVGVYDELRVFAGLRAAYIGSRLKAKQISSGIGGHLAGIGTCQLRQYYWRSRAGASGRVCRQGVSMSQAFLRDQVRKIADIQFSAQISSIHHFTCLMMRYGRDQSRRRSAFWLLWLCTLIRYPMSPPNSMDEYSWCRNLPDTLRGAHMKCMDSQSDSLQIHCQMSEVGAWRFFRKSRFPRPRPVFEDYHRQHEYSLRPLLPAISGEYCTVGTRVARSQKVARAGLTCGHKSSLRVLTLFWQRSQ